MTLRLRQWVSIGHNLVASAGEDKLDPDEPAGWVDAGHSGPGHDHRARCSSIGDGAAGFIAE